MKVNNAFQKTLQHPYLYLTYREEKFRKSFDKTVRQHFWEKVNNGTPTNPVFSTGKKKKFHVDIFQRRTQV